MHCLFLENILIEKVDLHLPLHLHSHCCALILLSFSYSINHTTILMIIVKVATTNEKMCLINSKHYYRRTQIAHLYYPVRTAVKRSQLALILMIKDGNLTFPN